MMQSILCTVKTIIFVVLPGKGRQDRNKMETLEEFKKMAEGFNPTIIKMDENSYSPNRELWFSHSTRMGGCGSDGCHCSPGLWITAFKDGKRVYVQFGTVDSELNTLFEPEQQRSFLDMCDELGLKDQ